MKKVFLAAAALLFASPAAWAQAERVNDVGPRAGDRELTLSGSGLSDDDFDTTSVGVSGSYGFYTNDQVLVGVRQSVNYFGIDDANDAWAGSTRGFLDYVFLAGPARPFVGVNVGMIYGDNVEETFAFGPEAGLKYYADTNTFIFGQVEYQILADDAGDVNDNIDNGVFNYTIGVGFNF